MQLLDVNYYQQIESFVEASGMRGHLALVHEVLDRRTGGRVFVDDLHAPRTTLVCNANGFYFGFGDPDEAVLRPQLQLLFAEGRSDLSAGVYGSSPAWEAPLRSILIPLGAVYGPRLAFELPAGWQESQPEPPPLPPGFQIEAIDRQIALAIVTGAGTHNYGIDPWFIHIAGGPAAYAALGLGMAITVGKHLEQKQIASICGLCGLGGGEVELEVGTVPAYQHKGLAYTAAVAFMQQCRLRGLRPAYSCSRTNTPSRALAARLGFVEMEEIHGFSLFKP